MTVTCPNCNQILTQRDLKRLHRFWTGLQAVPCDGCGTLLVYANTIRRKLKLGGVLLRIGLLSFIVILCLKWVFEYELGNLIQVATVVTIIAGVLVTRTRSDKISVEPFDPTRH